MASFSLDPPDTLVRQAGKRLVPILQDRGLRPPLDPPVSSGSICKPQPGMDQQGSFGTGSRFSVLFLIFLESQWLACYQQAAAGTAAAPALVSVMLLQALSWFPTELCPTK